MKENIQISIDKPCGQNFNNFKKTEKGGFCSNCQKEVIDFTSMSKPELFQFFHLNNDPVCGRFLPQQLGELSPPNKLKRKPVKLSYFVATFGLIAFFNQNEVSAQSNETYAQHYELKSYKSQHNKSTRKDSLITISGKVVAIDDNSSLSGVNIVVKGTSIGTITNIDGYYNLNLPNKPGDKISLIISFIGMATEEIAINIDSQHIELSPIEMNPDVVQLGGVFVRKWSPRGIWWKIKGLFKK